jgi:hypothetical protein
MAKMATAEENGKLVLKIYAYFHGGPGHVLRANNFVTLAARRHIPVAEIQEGLDYALNVHWIEQTENGSLRLTDRGFAAMPQSSSNL